MKVVYFVHDINDPAVHRRMRMLENGGATTILLGFSRKVGVAPMKIQATVLGYTSDAKLLQRALAVFKAALTMPRWCSTLLGADLIIARQLETIVLAVLARRLMGIRAPLVYECLDIHRVMLSKGLLGRAMRAVERLALSESSRLMVSSRGFIDHYFLPTHHTLPLIELVENKVLQSELPYPPGSIGPSTQRCQPGPPWRIGWYGMLRCRRSLDLLANLTRSLPGIVEVTIRGRVAETVLPDFKDIVASAPGLHFEGPYDRSTDLPAMYTTQHFFWAVDFFDGESSAWLLQNRLYEGGLFRCIPLARSSVETGRWLAKFKAGVLLDDPLEDNLTRFFRTLDLPTFRAAQDAMALIPLAAFLHDKPYCEAMVDRLAVRQVHAPVVAGSLENRC